MIRSFRSIRDKFYKPYISAYHDFYNKDWTPDKIQEWQLNQFNKCWASIIADVPFYQEEVKRKKLPKIFSSWNQFKELVPITDRKSLQDNRAKMVSIVKKHDLISTTGGSTAEPVQIPVWKSEIQAANRNFWFARSWYNVQPSDKLFMIWGHSHILGEGMYGWINHRKRILKDQLLGYCRISAYDMSEASLRKAAQKLLSIKPDYVISYAVALDLFARANVDLRADFHKLNLKVIIGTAESFPKPDSAQFIEDLFGKKVVMEYGGMETGPIAHQRPEGKFLVFWKDYYVEGIPSQECPGKFEIYITSLLPRCLPLIRYKNGDLISDDPSSETFNQTFSQVTGRCDDYICVTSGELIHSEAFDHAFKDLPEILNYQVRQSKSGEIHFDYVSREPLSEEILRKIRTRLERINILLKDVQFEKVALLKITIAGKTKRVLKE